MACRRSERQAAGAARVVAGLLETQPGPSVRLSSSNREREGERVQIAEMIKHMEPDLVITHLAEITLFGE